MLNCADKQNNLLTESMAITSHDEIPSDNTS